MQNLDMKNIYDIWYNGGGKKKNEWALKIIYIDTFFEYSVGRRVLVVGIASFILFLFQKVSFFDQSPVVFSKLERHNKRKEKK